VPAESGGAGCPQGLSWSWQLDFGALMAALNGTLPPGLSGASPCGTSERVGDGGGGDGGVLPGPVFEDEEAVQEQILDDLERYGGPRVPVAALAGRVAGHLAPGPDLAAWLAAAPVAELTGEGKTGVKKIRSE
jgi:hypothetical protein